MRLTQIVEALLFASDAPLGAADIARVDERLDEDTVEAVIRELRSEYEQTERAFQIYEVAGGYQLLTRPDFATFLERYETVPQMTRLSFPGLETLAIIAYRQPIGRAEIEEIRGVGSTGALKTLSERGLVEVTARGEGLGRPLLYGTTAKFLEHFGFRSLEDLPRPEELPVVLRARSAGTAPAETLPPDADVATTVEPVIVPESNGAQPPAEGAAPEDAAPAESAAPAEVQAAEVHAVLEVSKTAQVLVAEPADGWTGEPDN